MFGMSKPLDLEKLRSVSVAGSAMPTRKGVVNQIQATEDRWSRDFDAFRRLKRDGLHPARSDGAADVEARAEERHEVEGTPDPKLLEAADAS